METRSKDVQLGVDMDLQQNLSSLTLDSNLQDVKREESNVILNNVKISSKEELLERSSIEGKEKTEILKNDEVVTVIKERDWTTPSADLSGKGKFCKSSISF